MKLVHKVEQFIRHHSLLQPGDSVVAAVSGGIDSVVMFDLLLSLREMLKLKVVVAHFNHQLRGVESDGDEEFVRHLTADRSIECYVERADTAHAAALRKRSIQEMARDLRYDFFATLRSSIGFSKIATAHSADDNAETILFNMIRGAGVHGLSGIPLWRKDLSVIRPLLNVTREEIEAYAREQSLSYRVDSTNVQSIYKRNFLRNAIIPLLKENVNPNLVATLGRTAELFTRLDQLLTDEARRLFERVIVRKDNNEIVVDIETLHAQPAFMQEYILLLAAQEFSGSDIDYASVKSMITLSHAETGSSCSLRSDCGVFRDRNRLVFRRGGVVNPFYYKVQPNKTYEFEHFRFSSTVSNDVHRNGRGQDEYIDADCLGSNLVLRNWSEGDWFYPLGMEGKKKLSDFFIDEKVPLYEKHTIPVFESDGAVVWICGKRLDDRFKITKSTKRILKLEYVPQMSLAEPFEALDS